MMEREWATVVEQLRQYEQIQREAAMMARREMINCRCIMLPTEEVTQVGDLGRIRKAFATYREKR